MTPEQLSTRRLNVMRFGYAFASREVLFSCSFVVILAVVPWGYAWRRYARRPGDAWR